MSDLGKPFLNQINFKKIRNQGQNAANDIKKPLAGNVNLIVTKTRPSMNY